MTLKIVGAASALLMMAASAQAAPAPAAPISTAPAAAPATGPAPWVSGPPIAGVCVFRNQVGIAGSEAGKAATIRMQQLRAQVSAELQAEQKSIQTDAQAIQAKRSTLTQEQLQQQAAPIQQRGQALEQKAQLRERELDATRMKVLEKIGGQMAPIVRNLYQQRHCAVLLGDEVLVGNPAMDLTPQAVAQLNTQMSTITFDREQLPQKQ